MEEPIDLGVGRGDHRRMVVSQVGDGRPAGEVGILAAIGGVDPDSLGAFGDDFGVEGDYGRDDVLMTFDQVRHEVLLRKRKTTRGEKRGRAPGPPPKSGPGLYGAAKRFAR